MALPSFLQAMFTPARSGSYQWQGRPDQGGGEFTGEQRDAQGNITYEGDAQDLIFKPRAHRGPGNTVGQKMPDATNATTGLGQSATQDMMDAVKATGLGGNYDSAGMDSGLSSMTGLEPGISSSITETALEPGGMSSISGVMQDWEAAMANSASAPALGYSMRDKFAEEGPGMLSRGPSMGTIPRHSNAHGFVGGDSPGSVGGMTGVPRPEHGGWATPMIPTATDSVRPGESWSGGWMDEQIPIQGTRFAPATERAPILRFLKSLFGGGESDAARASANPNARGKGSYQHTPDTYEGARHIGTARAQAHAPGLDAARAAENQRWLDSLIVPPDTLRSTGGQFKNIYEGQTGGDDVMNALQAYLRQRN